MAKGHSDAKNPDHASQSDVVPLYIWIISLRTQNLQWKDHNLQASHKVYLQLIF